MIRNEDGESNDDDDLRCEVAQILHLYENLDPDLNDDPCRAIVQWYSRWDFSYDLDSIGHQITDKLILQTGFTEEVLQKS